MRKITIILVMFAFIVGVKSSAHAQQKLQTITLKDGTILKGKLLNVEDDVYTIKTGSMGQIQIKSDDLISINSGQATMGGTTPFAGNMNKPFGNTGFNPGGAPQGGGFPAGQMQMIQKTMMSDPEIMMNMQEIMNDPELVNIFTDPSLLQDMYTMDPEKIQNNPNMKQLMNNPKFKKMLDSVGQKVGIPTTAP